jgi:hypothetical protein
MLDKLLRYGFVEHLLGKDPGGTILDVGAGPQGLGSCLPYRFVGVDPWYPEPPVATQTAVRASGGMLPFRDQSFDYVLCVEVLEHMSPEARIQVVREMCRIARRKIIITHPFGRIARLSDYVVLWMYRILRVIGVQTPWWLKEHFQHPFPDPKFYFPHLTEEFSITSVSGQENAFLHVLIVLIGSLRIVSRRITKAYQKSPEIVKDRVRKLSFRPFYRLVLVLERRSG